MSASVTARHGATAAVHCEQCDAVCCRLTVVLMPEDDIAEHLTTHTDAGLRVMARDEEGWCVALDGARMCCSIYEGRPAVCRRFVMGGPYCRAVRADYTAQRARSVVRPRHCQNWFAHAGYELN